MKQPTYYEKIGYNRDPLDWRQYPENLVENEEDKRQREEIEHAIISGRTIIIHGDPGVGKTTLTEQIKNQITHNKNHIPLIINCKRIAGQNKDLELDFIQPVLQAHYQKGFFSRLFGPKDVKHPKNSDRLYLFLEEAHYAHPNFINQITGAMDDNIIHSTVLVQVQKHRKDLPQTFYGRVNGYYLKRKLTNEENKAMIKGLFTNGQIFEDDLLDFINEKCGNNSRAIKIALANLASNFMPDKNSRITYNQAVKYAGFDDIITHARREVNAEIADQESKKENSPDSRQKNRDRVYWRGTQHKFSPMQKDIVAYLFLYEKANNKEIQKYLQADNRSSVRKQIDRLVNDNKGVEKHKIGSKTIYSLGAEFRTQITGDQ